MQERRMADDGRGYAWVLPVGREVEVGKCGSEFGMLLLTAEEADWLRCRLSAFLDSIEGT